MLILGIETSCDETAAALAEATGGLRKPRFHILSNIVSSQVKLHAKYGGVVPHLASREHEKNLPVVLTLTLRGTKKKPDLIAVTRGPGLEPCLWRGINFAKGLAQQFEIPIVSVNHLEGHIYSNWIEIRKSPPAGRAGRIENRDIEFPAVCLIVSGGHTELILMKGCGRYRLLGATRDDAAGEAYDKVARLLGLGYPGGPIIDRIASSYTLSPKPYALRLPRPMIDSKDYDFSFAGLKTAVLYLVRDIKNAGKRLPVKAICAEFQQAVVEVLVSKTIRAAREFKAKTIMISGGVSANSGLRKAFSSSPLVLFPPKELTTDNAAMIAMAGYFNKLLGAPTHWEALQADANLQIR